MSNECNCEQALALKDENVKLRERLIKASARCIRDIPLSDFAEDYNFKVPQHHLRTISMQKEQLRLLAIELREMADNMLTNPKG